ncbi:DUF402 domain-containing protein [Streptomyces sp. CMB-StM0423]|uniref:DUF402 domain-containing protein n=1 Tax=Streptomyces sp. CMB-StM0423 TaxID=2059884 RepID=UPI000C70A8DF|nr:DUF402 domain-containing protein [Streptomyces sp. CMB-StM0423]AUH43554.1 hypothetical protein CXR04_28300 [Streptomyces sp. CMB-StM0423]
MFLEDVRVHHRSGQWCPGVRTDDGLVAYDLRILPPWQVPGRPTTDRCFVVGDAGIQLTRPGTFAGALEGGWYVDVVELEEAGPKRLVVHDLYVDVIVLPSSRRYEVLDLDELAGALEDGRIDAATAARALRNAQRFIDGHLRDLDQEAPDSWPDFPPAAIRPLTELPPFAPG